MHIFRNLFEMVMKISSRHGNIVFYDEIKVLMKLWVGEIKSIKSITKIKKLYTGCPKIRSKYFRE